MMDWLRSSKLQTVMMVLLAVVLLSFFFKGSDMGGIIASLAEADLLLIGVAVSITMVTYLMRALRWKYLLAPVGQPRLRTCFETTVIGFMINFLIPPGRLGELARPYLLARREGFSASSALATIFLARIFDLITVIFLVGGWLLLGPAPRGADSQEAISGLQIGGFAAFAGTGIALAAMFAFVRWRKRSLEMIQTVVRFLPQRLEPLAMHFLEAFNTGLGVLVDRGNLARAGVLSVALWLNIAFAFWVGASACGIEIPFGGTLLVIGFLTVGVALPTPGAVGGYHVMCALALTLLFGVDDSQARAAALGSHAIGFRPVSSLGMVLFAREGLSFKEVKTIGGSQ